MTQENAENIFEGGSNFDWESYIKYRPDYTLSNFYQIIWDFHNEHSGRWESAHDVGSGPGNVAEILAPKFDQVVASDVSAFHVNVAQQRLGGLKNIKFKEGKAEDMAATYPAGSVDMITAAECLPLMEPSSAIASFAKLLRPGGTLAIWFYGGPIYVSEENTEVQALHREITAKMFDQFKPFKGTPWERTLTTISSWFDSVSLPSKEWKNVERRKWNSDRELFYSDMKNFDFELKFESQIKADKVLEVKDRTFWAKKGSFQFSKGFIDAQIPREKDYITPEIKTMFDKLEAVMEGREHDISWPVVLILATRK